MIEWANKQLRLKKRKLSPVQKQLHNFAFGQKAETLAAQYLSGLSYKILNTNVSFGKCEIDLVAFDQENQELVFVEVKSRLTDQYGSPSYAVDRKKLKAMAYVAGAYRRRHHYTSDFRFDIISVIGDNIEHFKNVTWIR